MHRRYYAVLTMTNSLFINRCETLFVTFKSGNYSSVTTQQVAKILEMELSATGQFISKVMKFSMLIKCGNARNTNYQLSPEFSNSLQASIAKRNDIISGVSYTVNWFISHPKKERAQEITLPNGRKLVRMEQKPVSIESQQAIDYLLGLIRQNGDLKAENELLKEEIEKLKKYEMYYKQIKDIKLC